MSAFRDASLSAGAIQWRLRMVRKWQSGSGAGTTQSCRTVRCYFINAVANPDASLNIDVCLFSYAVA